MGKRLKVTKVKKPAVSSLRPSSPLGQSLAPAPTPVREVVAPPQYAPYDPNNDPQVIAERAAAERRRAAEVASLAARRGRLNVDFGLGEGADPNNPWSKLALLKKSFDTAQKANQTSLAARGQLGSGAYQRAQRRAASGFAQGEHDLKRGWSEGNAAIDDEIRRVNEGAEGAGLAAVERYLERLNALNALIPATTVEQGGAFNPLAPILSDEEPVGAGIKKQKTTGKRKKRGS